MKKRCGWAASGNQAYLDYHDTEWGEKRILGASQEVVDIFDERKKISYNLNSVCKTDQILVH